MSVDGVIVARYKNVSNGSLPLQQPKGATTKLESVKTSWERSKPHLRIRSNFFDDLLEVDYRDKDSVVEFDPPAGSRGEKRRRAMESSSLKRVAFPILGGLGQAGWAIAVLVLGPIIARLLPHWDVDLPDWSLPQVHLPVPDLPDWRWPNLPQVHLPVPHVDLPAAPAWLVTLLEYDKVWKPVLFGMVFGVIALRNHRRSEAEKVRWRKRQASMPTT